MNYDMNVDYDLLCVVEEKMRIINRCIEESADSMSRSLINSEGFLSGKQYEAAKKTTMECLEISRLNEARIRSLLMFISRLKDIVEEYSGCTYE